MLKSQTKILYLVTRSDFGGAQRYVYDLATNLSDNFSVVVAGGPASPASSADGPAGREPGNTGELTQKLQQQNIRYVNISHLKRAISLWRDFLAFWQIVKLIKKERPDVIHLNSSKISILGSLAAAMIKVKGKRIKVVYTVHGWVFNEDLNYFKKFLYKTLERLTARFKDKIICLSEFEKNNTVKSKIAPAKKISVIYNGRKEIKFLSRAEARAKLNIPPDAFVIGSIGNLYKNKGYEYLTQAFTVFNIKYLILNIIGEGPENKNLKSKIINLKLENTVKFAGAVQDAAKYLKAFDIYVCSSIKEGLPYSILEAMQAGLPIVSTNVGGIPEVITDKKNGLLVETKNPRALAAAAQYLIKNPEVAKQLGERARQDVTEKYSLERMLDSTRTIYTAL